MYLVWPAGKLYNCVNTELLPPNPLSLYLAEPVLILFASCHPGGDYVFAYVDSKSASAVVTEALASVEF